MPLLYFTTATVCIDGLYYTLTLLVCIRSKTVPALDQLTPPPPKTSRMTPFSRKRMEGKGGFTQNATDIMFLHIIRLRSILHLRTLV